MFAFDRSALAVLAPLALLLAVVAWSNRATPPAQEQARHETPLDGQSQTVAANLPSR
jgi:hypothetical protein